MRWLPSSPMSHTLCAFVFGSKSIHPASVLHILSLCLLYIYYFSVSIVDAKANCVCWPGTWHTPCRTQAEASHTEREMDRISERRKKNWNNCSQMCSMRMSELANVSCKQPFCEKVPHSLSLYLWCAGGWTVVTPRKIHFAAFFLIRVLARGARFETLDLKMSTPSCICIATHQRWICFAFCLAD